MRHRVEQFGLDKYNTINHKATLKRAVKKDVGNRNVSPKIRYHLAHFWLALTIEDRAFSCLQHAYPATGFNKNDLQSVRAVIAMARTATTAIQREKVRHRLLQIASGQEEKILHAGLQLSADVQDRKALSKSYVISAFYAYTFAREDKEKKFEKNAKKPQAPTWAAQALEHVFGTAKGPSTTVFPVQEESRLASQLDFLTYLGLVYTMETAKGQVTYEGSPLHEKHHESVLGQYLDLQPTIREFDKGMSEPSTAVLRSCLLWLVSCFQNKQIVIPETLREHPCEEQPSSSNYRDWRDEVEVFVGIWHRYLHVQDQEVDDGWSKYCEDHLSLYPAELLAIILRAAMNEPSSSKLQHQQHYMLAAATITPADMGGEPTAPGRTNTVRVTSAKTMQRRRLAVSRAGELVERLSKTCEKDVWGNILDWFLEMNRLDVLDPRDVSFKADMARNIEAWLNEECLPRLQKVAKSQSMSRLACHPHPQAPLPCSNDHENDASTTNFSFPRGVPSMLTAQTLGDRDSTMRGKEPPPAVWGPHVGGDDTDLDSVPQRAVERFSSAIDTRHYPDPNWQEFD